MRIIDLPGYTDKKQLLTLSRDTLVIDAVKKMKDLNYGSVVIIEDGKCCGIFTERDVLIRIVAGNKNASTTKLSEVMTKDIKTAYEDDPLYNCLRRMTQGKFRHLPIVDKDKNVIGMISQGDLVAISWYELFQQFKSKTKITFFSYYQLCLLVISLVIYSTIIMLIIRG